MTYKINPNRVPLELRRLSRRRDGDFHRTSREPFEHGARGRRLVTDCSEQLNELALSLSGSQQTYDLAGASVECGEELQRTFALVLVFDADGHTDKTIEGRDRPSPIGLQAHAGTSDEEYKDIWIEVNPPVHALLTVRP